MDSVVDLVNKYGFPVVAAGGMGYTYFGVEE
jgi:NAD(P)H-dependent flavin oxidoreductase YrpB (nitropropane dioxygenase family)